MGWGGACSSKTMNKRVPPDRGVQPHSGAIPLILIRSELLASSHSYRRVDYNTRCSRGLSLILFNFNGFFKISPSIKVIICDRIWSSLRTLIFRNKTSKVPMLFVVCRLVYTYIQVSFKFMAPNVDEEITCKLPVL